MPLLTRADKHNGKFLNPIDTQIGGLGMMLRVARLYLANKEERVPRQPPGPFRTDVKIFNQPPSTGLRITWFGHSALLLEIDGLRILVDPVWDERASPVSWAGPKRFFPAPLGLHELPPLDAILVSHDHYDHLGAGTIRRLAHLQPDTRWITSLAVGPQLRQFGVQGQISELDWTDSVCIRDLNITAVPARHFSGRGLNNRFKSLWSSFVFKAPGHSVYYGADSGWWDGFAEISRQFGPFDLTMLEIGAYHELWKSIHLGPDGATEAFRVMGANGLLMPIHWGLFDLALHAWRQPIERVIELADRQSIKLWLPTPGLPTEVNVGREYRSNWWRKS